MVGLFEGGVVGADEGDKVTLGTALGGVSVGAAEGEVVGATDGDSVVSSRENP
jgi:hypothetical protein